MAYILGLRESIPQGTYDRMRRHPNFHIHTGAGWSGVLSLMNIDTKEVFTSDFVHDLYPEEVGRKK